MLTDETNDLRCLKVMAVAQMLAISPNTAASRYRYAIEKLRKLLEDRS